MLGVISSVGSKKAVGVVSKRLIRLNRKCLKTSHLPVFVSFSKSFYIAGKHHFIELELLWATFILLRILKRCM